MFYFRSAFSAFSRVSLSHTFFSSFFSRYAIKPIYDCAAYDKDIASTDLLATQRDQQQSQCGNCVAYGAGSFMVIGATLRCSMEGDDLFEDGQGGKYACEGNGGYGWKTGLGVT